MARHLPYRRGDRGVYLPEEIGLIAGRLNRTVQLALIEQAGLELTEEESEQIKHGTNLEAEAELKRALEDMSESCAWFQDEAAELKAVFDNEGDPNRYFIPIQDPEVERIAVAMARVHFGFSESDRSSLIGRISGLFRR